MGGPAQTGGITHCIPYDHREHLQATNLALGQTGAGQNNRRPQVRNYWEKMGQTGKRTKKDRCYITV